MIHHYQGDLLASGAEALVNPVNCVGVAGAGLAKAFRLRWPAAYRAYRQACENGRLALGRVVFIGSDPIIICFPTKNHWKDVTLLESVKAGLDDLRKILSRWPVSSIAIPALGCGLGGLDWQAVRPLIEAALGDIDGVEVMLYGPQEAKS